VWLFVDALDECGKQNAVTLVKVFQSLLESLGSQPTSPRQFRICFSCRHYPILGLHGADGSVFEICAEDENASDISTFVHGQLAQFSARTPSALPALITKRASGIFMWARLVVERILDLELEGSGLGKMEAAVRSTPPDLDDLYRQLIQNMEPASLKLVEWICFAQEPLSIERLRWAMVIEADHPYKHQTLQGYQSSEEYVSDPVKIMRRVQTLSRGLAEVTPATRAAQFIHQSVKDFFLDKGLLALSSCETPATVAINTHLRLSKICIRYLTMHEICSATSDDTYGFRYYVKDFLMAHAEQCDAESAQEDLLAFLGWPSKSEPFVQSWVSAFKPVGNFFDSPARPEGYTLAHVASQRGAAKLLTAMLRNTEGATACIDAKDSDGRTPLSFAAEGGHTAVVKLLLDTGEVDVDMEDEDGWTPLFWAVRGGHTATTKLLLDTGRVNTYARDYISHASPMYYATSNGHEAIVQLLLDKSEMDVDWKDDDEQTLLSHAAARGYEALVRKLLGVSHNNVDSKDINGGTPLSFAVMGGHTAVFKLLLDTGDVNVNTEDNFGRTPLYWAAQDGHTAITKLLLGTGKVDVGIEDHFGMTALLLAARKGHTAVFKLLLDTGEVDVNMADRYGQTPLFWAAEKGDTTMTKLLLGTGKVDVGIEDHSGTTALSWAAAKGHESVVKLLEAAK
jgi:ankyrin repeat protein